MHRYILCCGIKKLRHHFLGQPNRLILQKDLKLHMPLRGRVENEVLFWNQSIAHIRCDALSFHIYTAHTPEKSIKSSFSRLFKIPDVIHAIIMASHLFHETR